jgi:hypothetical protein
VAVIDGYGPDQEVGNLSGPGQPIPRPRMITEWSERQLEVTGARLQFQI